MYIHDTGHNIVAFKDTRGLPYSTVRHTECSLLLDDSSDSTRCPKCASYRAQLNVLTCRWNKRSDNSKPQSHANYRYLSDSEKDGRMRNLHHSNRVSQRRIAHLESKLKERIELEGEQVEESMSADLEQIIRENDHHIEAQYGKDTFMHLFWKQQKDALSRKNTKGMRWHPLMIRWCLYLRHQSSKAYDTLRDAGLFLPSQRTLRDYTYSTTSGTGFSSSVDHQLLLASKATTCKEWEKYVAVLIDEMYIRYNKKCNSSSAICVYVLHQ